MQEKFARSLASSPIICLCAHYNNMVVPEARGGASVHLQVRAGTAKAAVSEVRTHVTEPVEWACEAEVLATLISLATLRHYTRRRELGLHACARSQVNESAHAASPSVHAGAQIVPPRR